MTSSGGRPRGPTPVAAHLVDEPVDPAPRANSSSGQSLRPRATYLASLGDQDATVTSCRTSGAARESATRQGFGDDLRGCCPASRLGSSLTIQFRTFPQRAAQCRDSGVSGHPAGTGTRG